MGVVAIIGANLLMGLVAIALTGYAYFKKVKPDKGDVARGAIQAGGLRRLDNFPPVSERYQEFKPWPHWVMGARVPGGHIPRVGIFPGYKILGA